MDENVFDPTYGGELPLNSDAFYDFGYGDYDPSYDFWTTIGVDPNTTMENWESPSNVEIESAIQGDPSWLTFAKKYGDKALSMLKDKNGNYDLAKIASLGIGAYSLAKGKDEVGGYNKPVPKMDVVAERPVYDDTNRRPGEAGRRYFTNPLFVAQGDTANMQKAYDATMQQKAGLEAAAPQYAAPAPNPYAGKIPTSFSQQRVMPEVAASGLPAVPTREQIDMQNQQRQPTQLAQGGIADAGRYLQGKTDGMADEIPSSIDGEQPAALSHGEFVIPADVVSHLGNGNSEAGAEKLYEMMARIRKARTGTTEQGKEIDADEFTMGGLAAAYAGGGAVKGFDGTTGSDVVKPTATTAGAGGVPLDTSRTSTLSPWVGDYVTNALGQGAALASAPYQAYTGPLTAGASNLQQQAFAGASDIASAGYTPGSFTGGFGTAQANQYMNPYLQASLDPQLKELQRQSDIQRIMDTGRLTQAGAFGGSRQAIMESEGRRNLLDKQQDVLGQGYKTAYDLGLGQFNKEREAEEASRQFGANFGLKSLDQLSGLGAQQRGITSEGIAADKAQFEEQRDFAYKMPQYQKDLLQGLPVTTTATTANTTELGRIGGQISDLQGLYDKLSKLGQTPT